MNQNTNKHIHNTIILPSGIANIDYNYSAFPTTFAQFEMMPKKQYKRAIPETCDLWDIQSSE